MKNTRYVVALAAAIAATIVPVLAMAQPRDEASLTYYSYSFTSPGDLYGPWYVENLSNRAYFERGSVGLELENESTLDRLNPRTGQYVVVDNYYDWTPRFYTYAAVGIGTGQPFPSSSLSLEGDFHMLHSPVPLVMGVGVNVTRDATGITERYLTVGPTYYWPHFNATVRYLPLSATNGNSSSASTLALEYGDEGRALTDLTVQSGGSLLAVQQNGITTIAPGERNFSVDLEHKQWISPRGGYRIGVVYGHLSDRATGNLIYLQRGIVLGVFSDFGAGR